MTRVSVAVTHAPTPERKLLLAGLLESLPSADVDDLNVVSDEDFDGVWPTTKRALLWGLRRPSDYLLLLPDDSIVCRDFMPALQRAVAAVPASPIVFYTGLHYTKGAESSGLTWTRLERCEIGCVGLVMPMHLLQQFLTWEASHFNANYRHSDVRIEAWAYLTGNYIWATEPSLVQHTGEGKSLMGHNGHESHHARHFIGADKSADAIDFSLGAKDPAISKAKMPAMIRKVIKNLDDA